MFKYVTFLQESPPRVTSNPDEFRMNFRHETRMFAETNNEPGTSSHSYSDDEDGDQSFQDSESKWASYFLSFTHSKIRNSYKSVIQ